MTTTPLLKKAGYENSHGKAMLARLVARGLLANPKGAKPRGYRLPPNGQDRS